MVKLLIAIGVNDAGVAGVAILQYLTCKGRPVLTTPNILTSVLFFSFSLWRHGFASLYRLLGTNWYFYKVYYTTATHGTHES